MIVVAATDQVVGYALSEQLADTGDVRNVMTDPAARRRLSFGPSAAHSCRVARQAIGDPHLKG